MKASIGKFTAHFQSTKVGPLTRQSPVNAAGFLSRIITTEPSEGTSVVKMSVLDVEGLQSVQILKLHG